METETYGLLIQPAHTQYGGRKIVVNVVAKNGEGKIRNISSEKEFADFELRGYFSDTDGHLFGLSPIFKPHLVETVSHAMSMAKTLACFYKLSAKAKAHECGDVFMVFAKTVGAKFVLIETSRRGSTYDEIDFAEMTLLEGRNSFRHFIDREHQAFRKAA